MLNAIIGALQPLVVGVVAWAIGSGKISADSVTGIGTLAAAIAAVTHSAVTTVAVSPPATPAK